MGGTSTYATGTNDTAATIVDNVTATDADQPNGIAAGVIQIETILGIGTSVKGSTADLVARLAVEHNADGTQKTLAVTKGGTAKTYDVVPTGIVMVWTTTSAPTGFLLCDGSAVNRTTYADLYAVVGTTYGVGDGATTFNLPDLLGRVVIMVDGSANRITASSTNGGNADTLGGAGGAQTHTLSTGEVANHTHALGQTAGVGSVGLVTASDDTTGTYISGTNGGGGAHSNTQPWIALEYVIKY
jgi:microcystin-dependent protein